MSALMLDFEKIDMCKELTHTQRALIKKIHLLSKNEGFCYASNRALAEMMAMSASGIEKVVRRLAELGFINRVITKEKGNERHITLTKKCIEMFKKVSETVKKAGNNIKPKNPVKPTTPKQPKPETVAPVSVSISEEQKLDQEQPRLSAVNHNAYVNKFNRQPSQKLVDFEVGGKGHDVVLYQVILRTKISNVKTDLDSYLIGGAIKELGENVVVDKEITSGETKKQTKVIRQESTDCDYFTRNENGLLVCKYSDEPKQLKQPQPSCEQSSTDDDFEAKIEYMKQLQAQMLNAKRMW